MFKRGAGLAITLALAVAAVRYSAPAGQTAPSAVRVGHKAPPKPTEAKSPLYRGGCSAYLPEPADHGYPYDDNQGEAARLIDSFLTPSEGDAALPPTLHYAIALAPDPLHTNLSLMFDRQIVMIQQAAQDEGYTYNSSWLPWRTGGEEAKPLLADAQHQDELADEREACPGILLFRKNLVRRADQPDDGLLKARAPFNGGLIVFLVGEQPTGGINQDQWHNAVAWLANHATPSMQHANILRVLGPTFSGSLDSLERDLAEEYASSAPTPLRKQFPAAQVFSGSITSCAQVIRLQEHLRAWTNNPVQFGSFQENDELQIYRFLSYMKRQGSDPSNTAILSEDETSYAQLPLSDPTANERRTEDSCNFNYQWDKRPVHMVYPRDISALRDAYEKESVFQTQSSSANEHATHAILRNETQEKPEGGGASDTITQFSGQETALSQEAYLFGVVSYLRTHHTRFLMLRCTNPLDFLFLTRFFHRAYPEARVVTVGSDLLFRREIDTTEFRGVLALSTYPLLPRDQHWSMIDNDKWGMPLHNHLIFENGLMEGIYVASRYLLKNTPKQDQNNPAALALERRPIPDYADPFWLHKPDESYKDISRVPPTWLSTVGRDGYWPLAVLNDATTRPFAVENQYDRNQSPPPSTMVHLIAVDGQHYPLQAKPDREDEHDERSLAFDSKERITLPTPWNVFEVLGTLLLCYQAFGLVMGPMFLSDGILLVFRRIAGAGQALLLGGSCALALMILIEVLGVVLLTPNRDVIYQSQLQSNWGVDVLLLIVFFTLIVGCLSHARDQSAVTGNERLRQVVFFLLVLLFLVGLYVFAFWQPMRSAASAIPSFYRTVHLSDGASPLLPVLLLTFGFYLWNWQAMAGNLLLAQGLPTLPALDSLGVMFHRLSQRFAETLIEHARPLSFPIRVLGGPIVLLIIFFGTRFVSRWPFIDPPLLSMEGGAFNLVFNALLLFGLLLTCAEGLRLYWTWIDLRRLLLALGRTRLRRTFAHLRAIDANSLWSVSGNVQRTQYRIFIQQLNAVVRLLAITGRTAPEFEEALSYGNAFRESTNPQPAKGVRWDEPVVGHRFVALRLIRDVFTETTDFAITQILHPAWQNETSSLNFRESIPTAEGEGEGDANAGGIALAASEEIQAVEEFVCLHYIAFIQNIAARMRTMALSMVTLFLAVCFAISFYPFVPRTSIGLWMGLNLVLIAAAVAYVYAGMERDEILSYITSTRPGRLGGEFWLKLAAFLAGPAIGLLTTQFPTIADSVLSWLQPGIDALK